MRIARYYDRRRSGQGDRRARSHRLGHPAGRSRRIRGGGGGVAGRSLSATWDGSGGRPSLCRALHDHAHRSVVARPSVVRGCPIRQEVMIGRYLTPDAWRLGLSGLAAGLLTGFAWRAVFLTRWGAVPFLVAVAAAARATGRSDWFDWDGATALGVVVTSMAGVGAVRLLADRSVEPVWVAMGSVVSAAGVWAGVPETGPALLVGGGLMGLAVASVVTRSRWGPAAGLGAAAVLCWAALSGAAGRPWAAIGGALCTGVAPWFALRPRSLPVRRATPPASWLLGAHCILVLLAARWIGVVPDAGWGRVAFVGCVGTAVVCATGRHARTNC